MLRHWGCRLAPDPSRVVTKKKKQSIFTTKKVHLIRGMWGWEGIKKEKKKT